jgi:hypothetical protein
MALLPAGEASIKRADDLNVGDGANKRHVTAYLIEGLGFSPSTVWLTTSRASSPRSTASTPSCARAWSRACRSCSEKQEALASTRTLELARTLIAQAEAAGRDHERERVRCRDRSVAPAAPC